MEGVNKNVGKDIKYPCRYCKALSTGSFGFAPLVTALKNSERD
jgi:hypothetical protein